MGLKEISDKYDAWKTGNAETKLALDLAPYTGQVMSAADVAQALYKGDPVDAAENALGFIPGLKAVRRVIPGSATVKSTVRSTKNTPVNAVKSVGKILDAGNDANTYKETKDGNYKRGGRVRATGYRGYGKAKKV